jgi:hypothetical protein
MDTPAPTAAFPFMAEEWSRVSETALVVVNATFAEDDVLRASGFEEMRCLLHKLREKYGQHPALLETEADFTDEPAERIALYEQAREVALAGGWVTYSIRIALASVLLEDLGDVGRALRELLACRDEIRLAGDKAHQQEWRRLQKECTRRIRARQSGE